MTNWRAIVAQAEKRFAAADIADPDISARLIGQQATGAEPGEWAEISDGQPHQRQLAHFDAMVERRCSGEPLQYVIGHWGFRYLDLFIDDRVLIPRPETETVAGLVVDEIGSRSALVADLGTGSGAIGLSVAYECPQADVWLTDVSPGALAVARANLAGLGTRGSRVQLAAGSWFEALPEEAHRSIDVVVSNPPYVGSRDEVDPQIRWEPTEALFVEPADRHLVHLVSESPRWLNDDGLLVLEMAPEQTELIREAAAERFSEVVIVNDLAGRARCVAARHPRRGTR